MWQKLSYATTETAYKIIGLKESLFYKLRLFRLSHLIWRNCAFHWNWFISFIWNWSFLFSIMPSSFDTIIPLSSSLVSLQKLLQFKTTNEDSHALQLLVESARLLWRSQVWHDTKMGCEWGKTPLCGSAKDMVWELVGKRNHAIRSHIWYGKEANLPRYQ